MTRLNSLGCLLLAFLLLSICSLIHFARTQSTGNPELSIPQGRLRGGIRTTSHGRNVSAFLGIPYAQPPIGNLRFANPVPASGWNAIRNASVSENSCLQMGGRGVSGQEDCLYLDVYTPKLPENTNSSLLPVMVFIHGGAFMTGSSASHNPHFLLNKDVLLVVPNYRLGPLGFLSTGDEIASGNWGLKDQILALKWVQDNIRYFGGDPDRVTLFGQSAGGAAVHLLTLMDATQGLFHKYITQSGSALARWAYQPRSQCADLASELGKYVGCYNKSSDSLINCLRKVDARDIIATHPHFIGWQRHMITWWAPTDEPDIEGAVLTESPANLFAAGKVRDLPWITGVVRDEGLMHTVEFYVREEIYRDFLNKIDFVLPIVLAATNLPDSGAAMVEAVKSFYFDNDLTANASVLIPKVTRLMTDALFNYPAHSALRKQFLIAKNPQYFYNFHYRGTFSLTMIMTNSMERYGITHGDDMIYLNSRTSLFASYGRNMTEADLEMADIMVDLWTSFATNGTPTSFTPNGSVLWDSYSLEDNYLRIGNMSDLGIDIQYSFYAERMQFWANLEAAASPPDSVSPSSALSSSRIALSTLLLLASRLILTVKMLGS